MFKDMRVRFCKQDAAIFFSHLDLNRVVQRALRRSGVPFWSTGAYSPHPYCVFAQPLSLGFESRGELFDFRLADACAPWDPQALADAFPPSLRVLEIYEPRDAFKLIAFAAYTVTLHTAFTAGEVARAFEAPLPVLKKTKRSETEVDLREFVRALNVEPADGGVTLRAEIAAGNDRNLSPQYLAEGLCRAGISCTAARVCREGFLKADGSALR